MLTITPNSAILFVGSPKGPRHEVFFLETAPPECRNTLSSLAEFLPWLSVGISAASCNAVFGVKFPRPALEAEPNEVVAHGGGVVAFDLERARALAHAPGRAARVLANLSKGRRLRRRRTRMYFFF